MRTAKLQIIKCDWAKTSGSKWMIRGLRNELGKVTRKFFRSRDDAQEWLRVRRPELVSQGRSAMTLSDQQRIDAVTALNLLAVYRISLTEAAKAYVEHAQLLSRTVTFHALAAEVTKAKKADGASFRFLKDLRLKMRAFGVDFGDRPVADIRSAEIDDWLRALNLAPVTRNNYRRNLGVAFSYALDRGYVKGNPIPATAEAKIVPTTPGILTPAEFRALLMAAPTPVLLIVAIGGFAGLREAEIFRLNWSDVKLCEGHICVDATTSKTASRRIIPITPALAAWITPFAKSSGGLGIPNFHHKLRAVRAAALTKMQEEGLNAPNLAEWPHNALRHSFVSYRLAQVNNSAQVAMEAGHGQAVLHRHYKALVTAKDAEMWFSVMPPAIEDGKVVAFAG